MGKISKQPVFRGIVVVSRFDGETGYGFVEPIGDGARENNVFFSSYAHTRGETPEVGDEVDFIFSKKQDRKRAFRIWIRKRAVEPTTHSLITTLPGEDSYEPWGERL
jgi:cold shock CspA family protein